MPIRGNKNRSQGPQPRAYRKGEGVQDPEQIFEAAREEGYELSNEEQDGIAGGWSRDTFGERSDCHLNQWYE